MKKILWGILGTGIIADKFATGLAGVEDAELFAVASRKQQTADQFAQRFKIRRAYASYEELACDRDVDIVYIATPHKLHYENTLLCLNNNKHVLCEKPFTVNTAQAQELFQIAESKHLFLMEAVWTRFVPGTQQVQKMVSDGVIGEVLMVKADFGAISRSDPKSRFMNPDLAGGALLDMGIYTITMAYLILGENPKKVISTASMSTTGVDEQNALLLQYENGAIAELASSIRTKLSNTAYLLGTNGKIILDRWWCTEHIVWELYNGAVYSERIPVRINGYEYEAEEACRCIRAGLLESPVHPHSSTMAVMKTMDAIRRDWGLKYPFEK